MKAIRIDPRLIKPTQNSNRDYWNIDNQINYPDANIIQFTYRNYSPEKRTRTRVLDLGCGSGINTAFFAREGFKVTGVDISEVAIADTLERLSQEELSFEKLHCTSLSKINFNSASFDLVVSVGVFDYSGFEETKKTIRQVYDILKVGGKGMFSFASNLDSRTDILKHLNFYGFSDAEVRDIFSFFPWKHCYYDRYITTFQNNTTQQNNFLITVEK